MNYLGIDPGLNGGFAFILSDGSLELYPMPLIGKKDYDIPEISRILRLHKDVVAVIEKQHAMPGQGLTSTLKTGLGFGILQAALSAIGIPFDIIPAIRWQKNLFVGLPQKQDTKVSSEIIAKRLFPSADFRKSERSRVANDGLTDAACIAAYCKRIHSRLVSVNSVPHVPNPDYKDICIKCGAFIPAAEDDCTA